MEAAEIDKAIADAMQLNLYRLLRSFEACDQHCLAQYGITASQGYALLTFPTGGDASMNELSRAMGLANSTMTRMVENLVSLKLVRRWQDANDRRVVRVALTAGGKELRAGLVAARRELLQRVLDGLRKGERATVLGALEKLNGAVEKTLRNCCGG